MNIFAKRGAALLAKADLKLNDESDPRNPQAKHPEALFRRAFFGGSLAFSESYMAEDWDCKDLFGMLGSVFESGIDNEARGLSDFLVRMRGAVIKVQTVARSVIVAKQHYDLG